MSELGVGPGVVKGTEVRVWYVSGGVCSRIRAYMA